jgi:aspartate dehydrogenase
MRLGGLRQLRYRGIKPPLAWRGSPAENQVDLDHLSCRTVLFEGTARAAALAFPQNANVAATIALAGLGFDATRVELVADPTAVQNTHEIEAKGATGNFHLRIEGVASASNPKTSSLTALSVARALVNEGAGIVL